MLQLVVNLKQQTTTIKIMTTEEKRSHVFKMIEEVQDKMLNREHINDLEKELLLLSFTYGKFNGAKEAIKKGLL